MLTSHKTLVREITDICIQMEFLMSEIDHLYHTLRYLRSLGIYIRPRLDVYVIGLYEHLLSIHESVANTIILSENNKTWLGDISKLRKCTSMESNTTQTTNTKRIKTLLMELETKIEAAKRKIKTIEKYYSYIVTLRKRLQLENNELVIHFEPYKYWDILITDRRIFIIDNRKNSAVFFKINDPIKIEIKKRFRFQGLKIWMNGPTIKIPMKTYDAYKLKKRILRLQKLNIDPNKVSLDKLDERRNLLRPNLKLLRLELLRLLMA